MDIASALGATPPAPPPEKPLAQQPARPDRGRDGRSSFEKEFDNASSPAHGSAKAATAKTAEPEDAPDSAAVDPAALLIDAEEAAAAQAGEIAQPVVTAPSPPVGETLQAGDEQIDAESAPVLETPAEIEPQADAEPVVEGSGESEASVVDGDAPTTDAAEPDDLFADAGEPPSPIPAPGATTPAVAPVVAAPTIQIESGANDEAAPMMAPAPARDEELAVEMPVIRDTREKPVTAHADKLAAFSHRMQEAPADASVPVLRSESAPAHTSRPEFHVAAARTDSAAVANQVVAAIRTDRGSGSIDVRLDPPELGRVRIQFNMERADVVVATVSSERGETLDLLRRHSADLARELERAGFANVQLDFTAGDSASFERWDQSEQQGYDILPEAIAEEQIVAFVRKAQGRLDRFV